MHLIKPLILTLAAILVTSCTSIPKKVPELIEVSANSVDTQSALMVAEWETSIASANSSKKLIQLIYSYISSIDKKQLSEADKSTVDKFLKAYPYVIKQQENVISQSKAPQKLLSRFENITNAIRLANSYIARSVDENARIEATINSLSELTKEIAKGDKDESTN